MTAEQQRRIAERYGGEWLVMLCGYLLELKNWQQAEVLYRAKPNQFYDEEFYYGTKREPGFYKKHSVSRDASRIKLRRLVARLRELRQPAPIVITLPGVRRDDVAVVGSVGRDNRVRELPLFAGLAAAD